MGNARGAATAPATADISSKVKGIMNQAYQMLASKFKAKDSYTTREILGIIVAVIKVGNSETVKPWAGLAGRLF